jgi:PAS domain S-box-containing protein
LPLNRSTKEIHDEITTCVGFFPPFFDPAVETPAVLENLWQQTLCAYLTNTIPPVFKEKLGAMLGRYLSVPYCLFCHSSTLSGLGIHGGEILKVLERPLPNLREVPKALQFLKKLPDEVWPEPGSDLEDVLLEASIVSFFDSDQGRTVARLKEILPADFFNHLVMLISYNKTSVQWVQIHPEVSYKKDQRYLLYFEKILAEEPRLKDYFEYFLKAQSQGALPPVERLVAKEADRFRTLSERDAAYRKLRLERDWLLEVVNLAPFAISMLSAPERRYVIANEAFERMTGGSNLLGKTTGEAFPELLMDADYDRFNAIWDDGNTMNLPEIRFRSADDPQGEGHFFHIIRQAKRSDEGQIEGVLTYALNISDQVSARHSLENQQQWLEAILDRMPVGLMMVEKGTGLIVMVNEAANHMFGQQFPLRSAPSVYEELMHLINSEGRRLGFEEFPSTRAARGEKIRDEVIQWRTSRGNYYISLSADPLPPIFGHPDAVIVALNDVTASKVAELEAQRSRAAAERSESQLILAVEASQLGFWEYDLLTQHVEWSETYRRQFDFPEGQYSGKQSDTMARIHPDDRDQVAARVQLCLDSGDAFLAVYRVVSRSGRVTWIEGRGRFLYDDLGRIVKFNGTCLDVTESRKVQDELRLAKELAERGSEAKSAFLANMSHEIRTPLTAIMGYTDLLKEEGLTSAEREGFINVINRNGKALTRLIEDILDLSKVEAGKLVTENNHFSLRVLLSDVAFIFGDLAEKKGIHFISEIADDTPDFLITDSVRLRQILVNIVGNAIKFTGSGYVKVTARVEPQNHDEDHILLVEVEDSGIGLSVEEINRLFEPFVQADESTSRRYGGTGLGLALSRRLAHALGGNITILRSHPGKGSCFLISIHVGLAPDDRDDLRSEKNFHLHRDVLEGVRILLVEDAPDNSLLISNMLGYYGAEVETASNGRDGVDMALSQYFDVVLMDIQMPLMDGYEAFQRLKSANYQSPIIALTAHAMPEERKRTSQLGFVAHITKPIDPVELISCIHKFSYLHRSLQSINP